MQIAPFGIAAVDRGGLAVCAARVTMKCSAGFEIGKTLAHCEVAARQLSPRYPAVLGPPSLADRSDSRLWPA